MLTKLLAVGFNSPPKVGGVPAGGGGIILNLFKFLPYSFYIKIKAFKYF
jgi:hypothetical protein